MAKLELSTACLVALALLGCAHGRGDSSAARGVVVTLTRITVTPTPANNPGARWDQGQQDSRGDEGCGLLAALNFVAPGVGTAAHTLCSLGSRRDGSDWNPEDPDLFVAFQVGSTTYRSPVIADRASHDLNYPLFIPREAMRESGLHLAVYDRDGESPQASTLIADHQLRWADLDNTIELRGEDLDEPSLKLLRLELDHNPQPQTASQTIAASAGLVPIDGVDIPAGMLVEIRAKGQYRIGSWNDDTLGPSGYPGGGPRDYNLPVQVFRAAKHGAAVALVQRDTAAQAVVVGDCARFIAESGGVLYLGVNDRDYQNNSGSIAFEVRVTMPDLGAWRGAAVGACER